MEIKMEFIEILNGSQLKFWQIIPSFFVHFILSFILDCGECKIERGRFWHGNVMSASLQLRLIEILKMADENYTQASIRIRDRKYFFFFGKYELIWISWALGILSNRVILTNGKDGYLTAILPLEIVLKYMYV